MLSEATRPASDRRPPPAGTGAVVISPTQPASASKLAHRQTNEDGGPNLRSKRTNPSRGQEINAPLLPKALGLLEEPQAFIRTGQDSLGLSGTH